jgi:hypothetical protein
MSEPKGHQQISYSSVALDLTFASVDSRPYCRECQIRHTSLGCKNKSTPSKSTTVTPETSGIPRAMVLTASFVLSPVIGLVATVPAQCEALSRVSIGVEMPGPHGFAVRNTRIRLLRLLRPPHLLPHVRDDRETPLMRAEDGRKSAGDLPVVTSEKARGTLARRANQVMSRKRRQDPSSFRA